MPKPIRKAVFPVAGLGTRFLPATKAVPKELLPVVDRPLIDYAVAEAAEAGATHMIFVSSRRDTALERHYSPDADLEKTLTAKGKTAERDRVAAIVPDGVQVDFVYQEKPLGLGHAVLCAREIVGDEPFAVLLPDDLVQAEPGCLAQMTSRYEEAAGNFLAVETVPRNRTDRYGILETGVGEQPPGGLAGRETVAGQCPVDPGGHRPLHSATGDLCRPGGCREGGRRRIPADRRNRSPDRPAAGSRFPV